METQAELLKHGDELYERYGAPLEAKHWGKFVAISEDGRTIIGDVLDEVARQAELATGPRSFIFKIGERAVGHMR
jgi:hypothetical protein